MSLGRLQEYPLDVPGKIRTGMSSELDRQGLVDIFVTEASEALDVLTKAFHPSDETVPTPAQLQEQYVWAHKIRGASGLYGYEGWP